MTDQEDLDSAVLEGPRRSPGRSGHPGDLLSDGSPVVVDSDIL
jgi:hypothetical protein